MSVDDSAPGRPTPRDVLTWVADARPGLWFPCDHARAANVPRDALDEPLWTVRQAGLVQVGDWVRGKGQGFALTASGETALAEPQLVLAKTPAADPDRPDPPTDTPAIAAPAADDPDEPTTYDRGERARAAVYGRPSAVVSSVLIGVNVVVFLAGGVLAWRAGVEGNEFLRKSSLKVLVNTGAVAQFFVAAGDWWRLLTNMFVHVGLVHLLANVVGLAILGPKAETMWGRVRMIVLYLLAGLFASSFAVALRPDVLLAGASGGIYGLMTGILVWLVRYRPHLPRGEFQAQLRGILFVLFVNAMVSTIPGVSWEGHLGGGLAGAAAGFLLDFVRPGKGWRRWAAVAGLIALAAAGPLLVAAAIDGRF